jgi:catechol 2,3-dioxygenase-like lactoylglutathione lyase family enzyme
MNEPPDVRIDCLTVDCADPERLASFWCALLGYERQENFTKSVRIGPRSGAGPVLLFAPNPTPKTAKNRLHLDLRPTDRAVTVERAIALGARRVPGGRTESRWTVLEDPEGNEFCILQSEHDYAEFVARARGTFDCRPGVAQNWPDL